VAPETQKPISTVALEPGGHQRDFHSVGTLAEYVPKLSARTLTEAGFRRPWRLACVAALPMIVSVLIILFMPKRYQATMQLVVLNTRQYSVISSEADTPAKAVDEISDSDVNSQAQLLSSRDVLNQTLDQLGVPSSPAVARDRAIEAFERRLDVFPVRESNILNVSYVDSSPDKAREALQVLASSFVGRELALLRPIHGQQLFAALVDDRQRDLTAAQDEFAKFKVETGIASLKDDEAALLRQLEGSSSQSASLAEELTLERWRARRTDDELARHPERITTQNRSTPNQAAIESLTSLLVQLENKRTSLLNGYQPTERIVQDIEQQISNVKNQLSQLRAANAVETTTDMNPLNLELKSQLARAQISSTAIAAQRRAVDAQRQEYLSQLNQLEQRGAEFDSLQKRVTEAQRNLDLALQKRDQAAFDDALDKNRILNVAFAAKPSASSLPVQPRPSLYVALGLFIALFLGIGLCVVSELGRNTIYSPAELDALTQMRTLVAVPLQEQQSQNRIYALGEGEAGLLTTSHATIPDDGATSPLQSFVTRSTRYE
jgi:uncharacterized protein involved in exopolysaccharide biosynthesis